MCALQVTAKAHSSLALRCNNRENIGVRAPNGAWRRCELPWRSSTNAQFFSSAAFGSKTNPLPYRCAAETAIRHHFQAHHRLELIFSPPWQDMFEQNQGFRQHDSRKQWWIPAVAPGGPHRPTPVRVWHPQWKVSTHATPHPVMTTPHHVRAPGARRTRRAISPAEELLPSATFK